MRKRQTDDRVRPSYRHLSGGTSRRVPIDAARPTLGEFPMIESLVLQRRLLALVPVLAATMAGCTDAGKATAPLAAVTAPLAPSMERAQGGTAPATLTTIDVPGSGGTLPLDINNQGTVVGRYGVAGKTHGFLRTADGAMTTIDYPGASFTVAAGINDAGDIVGMYSLPSAPTVRHGYIRRNGAFTTIDPKGSLFTNALGINDRGVVVGRYCIKAVCRPSGSGDFRGFVYRNGEFGTLDVPGAMETDAFKINRHGEIVGGFATSDGEEELFVQRRGRERDIELRSEPPVSLDNGGINSRGEIVGLYCDTPAPCLIVPTGTHAFVRLGHRLTVLSIPGAVATSAIGINDQRDIVGGYYDATGKLHGYLLSRWTPEQREDPEPD